MDTIYAPATARGRAGVSVIRISGPQAWSAAAALCGHLPPARRVGLRRLRWRGEVLDEALVLVFARGESFTGEDVVELQLHGSTAVVAGVMAALAEQPGLRSAEAGEFTRRAFENGRLDLAQVGGLADLIESETEAQRRQAMAVLSGAVGARVAEWREAILHVAALVEASIDFADEEVPVDVRPEAMARLEALLAMLRAEVGRSAVAERLREGFEVAILGLPNAGKSTLLNALAGREAAITSSVAGTTRDVIEVRMDLRGVPVTLLDTAGLRATDDPVERIGIARTRDRAAAADLRVLLLDAAGERPEGVELLPDDIVVQGKADLSGLPGVSGLTGAGIDALVDRIGTVLAGRVAGSGLLIRARQREAVARAVASLESAQNRVSDAASPIELAAEDLRQAVRALAELIGVVDTEEVLGAIFGRFCIGK